MKESIQMSGSVKHNHVEGPLVSFCITCYNQERYIGDALSGAFAQTYRPIEIVISDDCSTDNTQSIIEKKIAEYRDRGGDCAVIFHRNERNLGNLGNWLGFGRLAHGAIRVKADGDDISLPERTEKVVAAWMREGMSARCISHRAIRIDRNGRSLGHLGSTASGMNWGSSCAYRRDCWSEFDVNESLNHDAIDDVVFSQRVKLLASVDAQGEMVIPDRLVYYRTGAGLTNSTLDYRRAVVTMWKATVNTAENILADLECAERKWPCQSLAKMRSEVEATFTRATQYMSLLYGGSIKERYSAYKNIHESNLLGRILNVIYLLPDWLTCYPLNLYEWMRRFSWLILNGEKLLTPDFPPRKN